MAVDVAGERYLTVFVSLLLLLELHDRSWGWGETDCLRPWQRHRLICRCPNLRTSQPLLRGSFLREGLE